MGARFATGIGLDAFPHDLAGVQIVYHAVNKSGSLAMANAMGEAYRWAGREREFVSHYRIRCTDEEFRARVDAMNGRQAFIVDHYLFGALAPAPNRIWITQLRHPLPRVLSFYQWIKNKHMAAGGAQEEFPSLREFVVEGKGTRHSLVAQFGMGFGPNRAVRKRRLSTADLYSIAVDALEAHVYALGIAEYFEESLFVFAALAGIESVAPWVRDNRNPGRPLADEISEADRALIEELYAYDYRLYEYALDRFRKQNGRLPFGESLARYREACRDQYKDRILPR
ncbi:hypothetical protein [Luteimonas wenzhouensis]|uniref:Sulfotransferase family protein n=1 Tax=Luteimonas wenzhouensis TaxID=2599615 RepID=A0A5C5TUZ6_9GAMM|nr:hypothetical protein [Luteimonas wenzhouensis]TWT17614.1 hypothetical protein FQY79_12185 [Luteimonas wenzhouensis]